MKRIVVTLLMIGLFGCSNGDDTELKRQVTVSIVPQKYFVERIVGDMFAVNVMIPPGASPAMYEPTPRQMIDVSRSVVYFRIGHIPFETTWLGKIADANETMRIVDTSKGVDLIEGDNHDRDDSLERGAQTRQATHRGIDPHIWLSPKEVKSQLGNILEALGEIDPANKEFYKKNHRDFLEEIDALDSRIRNLLEDTKRKSIMVFHPTWSYFARDYGLKQIAIEVEGKSPSPALLKALIDSARRENIKVVFVQKQFDSHRAQTIAAEIEGEIVQIDPLEYNWVDNMDEVARAFYEALNE